MVSSATASGIHVRPDKCNAFIGNWVSVVQLLPNAKIGEKT